MHWYNYFYLWISGLTEIDEFSGTPSEDVKRLQDELKRLQTELDECRSLVTVANYEKENVVETETRKRKEEIASIQRIMEGKINFVIRKVLIS